ncbi:MAG: Exodeoxyribonuclease III Xth [uncultured bacterium (gcode 4)]|uniref:Exodeoxyribonuclease III Xth n=1 Tax=uncultured bacterium (gcode 4) TaxID=1234023 RepID=K2G402_9BACT|nr:MAG: Exodeoxyribonuclease III Xth [uncultured bacterium (gcode 4)]
MKFISWNVNWIRAAIQKGFLDYINNEKPDIIALQEVKATEDQFPARMDMEMMWYSVYWNSASKNWYSWTAVFTKEKPLSVSYWLWMEEHDNEWRIITVEYEKFYFVTVYTPNSKRELERLEYRQLWDSLFLDHMRRLEAIKPIFVCWDLNVAHKEIDLTNPKPNRWNAWFTDEERMGFQKFLDAGFIDTFRFFYPDKAGEYSWWSNFANARSRNIGWRIDYFLASWILKENLKNAFIMQQTLGSDHCPVWIEVEI